MPIFLFLSPGAKQRRIVRRVGRGHSRQHETSQRVAHFCLRQSFSSARGAGVWEEKRDDDGLPSNLVLYVFLKESALCSCYAHDALFPSECAQQDVVFEEVSEFVQSALDGYNVTLFSYGQTGSGKTHTMQGVGSGSMRGIIPRSIEQVAQYKATLEEQGWT